jgi:3-hydroxyacyl-[acyl-carrier-protein] dehydratase
MKPLIDKEGIKQIIPHRDPFLLIDEIVELDPGNRVVGIKYVNKDEYYFAGHFPKEPVMPGVLIVEALAQTGAVAILSLPEHKGKTAYFGGIKSARFRQKVVPGDVLRLEVVLGRLRSSAGTGQATAYVHDKVVCECEILFAMN